MVIRATSASALAIVLAGTGPAAFARDAAAAQPDAAQESVQTVGLNDIVVTAQKRSESINDVPISITAVGAEELAARGIHDAAALQKVVPGFVVSNTYFGSPVYYLRGVGFYDTAIAARPSVALYADEAPIAFPIMGKGTTLDLERVEVLKGPQGTLFGSNATGGAINFVAAKPTRDFAGGGSLSFGRFNNLVVDGFLSGPLSETVGARVAIQYERMDDWQKGYTTNRTNGSKDILSGRGTLEARPGERLTLRLTASGTIDRSDTIAPQLVGKDLTLTQISPDYIAYPLVPAGSIRAADVSTDFPDGRSTQRDDWAWQFALRADYEATDDLTLTSLTSIARAGQDHGYEADGTTLAVTNLGIQGTVRTIFQEFRAAGSSGGFNYLVGANYQNDKSSELVTFLLPVGRSGRVFLPLLGLPAIDLVPEIADQKTNSWAVYASGDIELGSAFTLRGGIRYTETKTDFAGCAQAGGNLQYAAGITRILGTRALASGECATFTQESDGSYTPQLVVNNLKEDNVSWRVGLDYKPTNRTLLYASVSKGYKAGAFSNISAVFATQYVPVPQESLTAYEIGVKSDLVPDILHLNAAAFYYDYTHKQLMGTMQVPVFNRLNTLVSVPKSRVQGFEADVQLQPFDGFRLRAAATYTDTKVKGSFQSFTSFGEAVDFRNTEFPNTPKWQANGGAGYRWGVASSLAAFADLSFVYRGKSDADFVKDPRLFVPGYTLIDGQVGVESKDGSWRFQIWGRNLTNKLNYTTVIVRQEAIVRTVGMPRTFGATVGYKF
ncbi:MAG: TonB-dependent receptor [Alphaproteobacteria bacterium HGW-Alphaproteobacteria-13]|jgi:outer membrane receptor protein involved in Fe transport|nr:MAG: TonB-dependent receptor [Alphaproteobacteria bacterium HGW-Alphaproteobacteria-13]